jgi:hypothetical protein
MLKQYLALMFLALGDYELKMSPFTPFRFCLRFPTLVCEILDLAPTFLTHEQTKIHVACAGSQGATAKVN